MGCGSSGDKAPAMDQQRRRLSLGYADPNTESELIEVTEEDRGLITSMNQTNIVDMLKAADSGGRKFSIGSNTDQGKESFANKTMQEIGEHVDPAKAFLGYQCRKGLKPESPNQDSWFILKVEDFSIYGVFDGHGKNGHHVSNLVKDVLPKLIIKDQRFKTGAEGDIKAVCLDAFKKMQSLISQQDAQKKIDAKLSGTTATICVHDHTNNKLTTAHVADSTAVLASWKDSSKSELTAIPLTRDHKPNLPDEKARIEKNGGKVIYDGYANHRVFAKKKQYPGLNMSRCLGDLLGHQECGISCVPEVSERTINPEDHFLLLCSDGVWEFIQPLEASKMVNEKAPEAAMASAEKLAKASWDKWIKEENGEVVDDITVCLVYLNMTKTA